MSWYSLTSLKHRVKYQSFLRGKVGNLGTHSVGCVNLLTLHLFKFKYKAWLIEETWLCPDFQCKIREWIPYFLSLSFSAQGKVESVIKMPNLQQFVAWINNSKHPIITGDMTIHVSLFVNQKVT